MGSDVWRLTAPGVYCWRDGANVERLILVKPASRYACAKLVWDVVAASVNGGSAESNAYYTFPAAVYAFSLLSEPRVRSLNCGPTAQIAMNLLAGMGVCTRMPQWIGPTSGNQHQNLEALTERGWTLVDAHYGLMYADGYGAVDLWEDARANRPLALKLENFRNEASWVTEPWDALKQYDMAMLLRFGDVRIWPAAATVSEATVEAALGGGTNNANVLTSAEMRAAFYQ